MKAHEIGRLTAELAEPLSSDLSELIELLNKNIKPPELVTEDQIFIRSMYLVSDRVNSFGGRFPIDEFPALCSLLIDSPVMVGHRKDKLPIGRTFYAEQVERNGAPWIKSYFYWMRESEGGTSLKEAIDGGVVKECSIAFLFLTPECSICGKDIRVCRHEPFRNYDHANGKESCHFNYREIERVLESSLVYRGAVSGTTVTKSELDLEFNRSRATLPQNLIPLFELNQLVADEMYVVTPHYEGEMVSLKIEDGEIRVSGENNERIALEGFETFTSSPSAELPLVYGKLVGYKGKSRCSRESLASYLSNTESDVTRVVLYLYPGKERPVLANTGHLGKIEIRNMPSRIVSHVDILRIGKEVATRNGFEIWHSEKDGIGTQGYLFDPLAAVPDNKSNASRFAILFRARDGKETRFQVSPAACLKLAGKRALLVQPMSVSVNAGEKIEHELRFEEGRMGALHFGLQEIGDKRFVAQPVVHDSKRLLMIRADQSGEKGAAGDWRIRCSK